MSEGPRRSRPFLLVFAAWLGLGALLGLAPTARGDSTENPLVGKWQHSEPATPYGPASTIMVVFSPNGKYAGHMAIAGNASAASGFSDWYGTYRLTGSHSVMVRPEGFRICTSGGACTACPGYAPACDLARASIGEIGAPLQLTFEMKGANEMLSKGVTWFRIP